MPELTKLYAKIEGEAFGVIASNEEKTRHFATLIKDGMVDADSVVLAIRTLAQDLGLSSALKAGHDGEHLGIEARVGDACKNIRGISRFRLHLEKYGVPSRMESERLRNFFRPGRVNRQVKNDEQ